MISLGPVSNSRMTRCRRLIASMVAVAAAAVCAALCAPAIAVAAEVKEQQVTAGVHTASLEATINPRGTSTSCKAQYETDGTFEAAGWTQAQTVACQPEDLGAGSTPVAVKARLSGLAMQTVYVYRFETIVSGAVSYGPAGSFGTFGLKSFGFEALNEQQEPVVQAGGHPYELHAEFETYTTHVKALEDQELNIDGTLKSVLAELPPGLIGNPTAIPACTTREVEEDRCSGNAQVGVVLVYRGPKEELVPLYNTVAPEGTAAQFAGEVNISADAYVDASVRSGQDYGITSGSTDIPPIGGTDRLVLNLWSEPLSPVHNAERFCPAGYQSSKLGCAATVGEETPFLRMPTSCTGPLTSIGQVSAYQASEEYGLGGVQMPGMTGCSKLPFAPLIEASPSTAAADSPTGMNVQVSVPQQEPEGLAASDLKDATVTFPAGFVVNPSSASGLVGCAPAQIGLEMTPNSVQRVNVEPALDSAFTISFAGQQTGSLPWYADAGEVQQALEALPAVGAGNVVVSGNGGVFTVQYAGALASQQVGTLGGTVARTAVQHIILQSPDREELEERFGSSYKVNDSFNLALDGQSTAASLEAVVHTSKELGRYEEFGYIEDSAITSRGGALVNGEEISGPGLPEGTTIRIAPGEIELLGLPQAEATYSGTYHIAIPSTAKAEVIREALRALPSVSEATVKGNAENVNKLAVEVRSRYTIGFTPASGDEAKALELSPAAESVPQTLRSEYEAPGSSALPVTVIREGGLPHLSGEPAQCPPASKLGTVDIETPLLNHPIPGALYLATPHHNPFGSLIAVYLAAYDPISGVVIKLPGDVSLNKDTGQVSTTFDQNPQLPFEHLKVNLFADEKRAAFTTPETCGNYPTTSILTPWDGNPAATPASKAFAIVGEPGGGACPTTEAQAPNAAVLQAGTVSPIAGSYSPFVLKLTRQDGSQRFHALNVTLPPGMLGNISSVQECPQAGIEAAEHLSAEGDGAVEQAHPSCPTGSEVGVAHVGAGSGAPYFVSGKAYFAGPYKGAPFSLVFVTPAIAGPFDLGTVVVRAALYIDPHTAQVSVKSDPFPTILDGIPLDIRSVGVEMNRPDFTLNPTSCDVMSVTGSMLSTAGQSAGLSDRFQVGGCDTIPFNPSFTAETHAFHNRRDGAYLHVHVASGAGQANIGRVHVEIPNVLPARNDTLKLACAEEQFEKNPAGCPEGSIIGHAVAHTPILPVPLEGPVMFVSHGARGFPDVEVLLQGDGVNVTLEGETFIDKKGQTFSTFGSVPDVPVSSFDMYLPEGPHSALAGNGNLCAKPLYMPTTMTGQNGALIQQQTKVNVIGCRPELRIRKREIHGGKATIVVQVPSAGKLVATGKGITTAMKKAAKAKVMSVTVRLKQRALRMLAHHPHRKLRVVVRLRFKPKHGKPIDSSLVVMLA